MSRRLDEKHSRILAGLLKLPDNKKCFDCPSKVNVYANLFNSTFICERCSGLHRELNHRVKSISASTFTPEEVTGLQKGGNAVAKSIWLATWSWREYPEPDAHEVDEVRQFMRAKYVKKLWYQDPSGNNGNNAGAAGAGAGVGAGAGAGVLSSHQPSIETSSSAGVSSPQQQHPGLGKNQSVDSISQPFATGPALAAPAAFSAVPERNLSRKSSTLSSDSGSTTFSKSTDPSSTGSSPFSPAVATNASGQKTAPTYHPSASLSFQQQTQTPKQPSNLHNTTPIQHYGTSSLSMSSMTNAASATSFGAFSDQVRGAGQPLTGTGPTPGSNDFAAADPFSLMTNSFSTMGLNNTSQGVHGHGTTAPSSDIFGSLSMPMTNPLVTSPAPVAGESDPFSLAGARLYQTTPQPHATTQQPELGSLFTSTFSSPSVTAVKTTTMPTSSYASSTLNMTGTRSFDDYLLSMNQAQSHTSISPQGTGVAPATGVLGDPFGLMASASASSTSSPSAANSTATAPPPLQRAFTDYPLSNTHGNMGGSNHTNNGSNPFALFAKSSTVNAMSSSHHVQHQNPTIHSMASTSSSVPMDPFGHMAGSPAAMHQRLPMQAPTSSLAGGQDYFSAQGLNGAGSGHGSRSPNPFLMAAEGNGSGMSRPGGAQAAPAFMRSMSESVTAGGYNGSMFGLGPAQMPATTGVSNHSTASSGFESAFSVPSRSMTLPPTSTMAAGGSVNMNMMNMNMPGGDVFGHTTTSVGNGTSSAWQKTLPTAAATAASKYPTIDDLDPFSASNSSTSAAAAANANAASSSQFSNPFSFHT